MVCCSSVEDQDSSSEGGLSSNWWVLGSQGRDPLSTAGDATLQALPQPALSPFGVQNMQQQAQSVNSEHESASKSCAEQSHNESQEASDKRQDRNEEKQPDVKTPSGRNQVEDRRGRREHEANEDISSDKSVYIFAFCIFLRIENNNKHVFVQMKDNRRDECYGRAVSPPTQNSCIRITRPKRTSWKNGPTLRQSMRLPAHRPIHPLLTLLQKTDTLTTGRTRRTQTKIGFYRALAKGKINVRVSIQSPINITVALSFC